ncbi:uncharacterized protein WM277_021047 isoform 8-T8 [Molossus nigricans]
MATYPPRRLLGARPLPSDPCRDPRRSGFPQGSGGRWERRLPTGQGWGPLNLRCTFTHFQGPAARHITSRETWACAFPEQRLYFQPPYSRVVVLADKQGCVVVKMSVWSCWWPSEYHKGRVCLRAKPTKRKSRALGRKDRQIPSQ